jgi:tetratricopeptide (TPR) repeat protein
MKFKLPSAPARQTGAVKAWSEPVVIPTYHPLPPDKNPMFLEKRVYQGSSGKVYPLPFTDRIATETRDHTWQAVHLENEFLRVMVLPEVGGRIHVGIDKSNDYDFFYRQNVIKPALVGLAGPWISGGVEFNWPQHHRPATFMPVNAEIEEHSDGSRTIWCSDHDPMNRLKGMHGVCLHPGKAYIEVKVRLYNRTPFAQTFLWWANVGVHVHELYQSFFPPDVQYVADHAKRAVSRYPLCDGHYYGVNYGQRAKSGVPEEECPRQFTPPGTYPPNDLSWYANIPVPTSYMAIGSAEDFFGGYDHKRKAGLVHVANHHISPGKKQWTWGNHDFGYAWDRNLTDDDGPYIELMAGVFTDNQPDFSFLSPWETKAFSQYWYPIREIGPAQKANLDAALSLTVMEAKAQVGVCVTQSLPAARVRLDLSGTTLAAWVGDLSPRGAFLETADLPASTTAAELAVSLETQDGRELLRFTPLPGTQQHPPVPATEPAPAREIKSNDELYLTGLHLEQYRHATRYPNAYWLEALRRDPCDSRCNNAMGLWHLRRGEFKQAEEHFQRAIQRLTLRNPNPYDGESYYNLGLTLRYLNRDDEAYAAFYKSTWNQTWQAAAYMALAELDAKRNCWSLALAHLQSSVRLNLDNLNARNLTVMVLRKLNQEEKAAHLLQETLALDPMDFWARYLADGSLPSDNQILLDLSLDCARAGFYAEGIKILNAADRNAKDGSVPIVLYALGYVHQQRGDAKAAKAAYSEAAKASPDYCFPNRLEELIILQTAVAVNPHDARAVYYLGNLLYDRHRHREAIALWEQSADLDPSFSVVWRNLGIAYFNVLGNPDLARSAFDQALNANPTDARVLYERDQLWKRIGESPERRLAELENFWDLVRSRDDLSIELATLYNDTAQPAKALAVITSRKFQPWEGGEGLALGQHVRAHLALGRRALADCNPPEARRLFEAALDCPANLGEAVHLRANQSDVFYLLGTACEAAGDHPAAREWWERAAKHEGDFQDMSVKVFSEMTYYSALALKWLARTEEAEKLLRSLLAYAEKLMQQKAKIDYFATSLPAMLLFEDDLQKRNTVTATFLQAQAWLGLGDAARAKELLNQVLRLDRNHPAAKDLLTELKVPSATIPV